MTRSTGIMTDDEKQLWSCRGMIQFCPFSRIFRPLLLLALVACRATIGDSSDNDLNQSEAQAAYLLAGSLADPEVITDCSNDTLASATNLGAGVSAAVQTDQRCFYTFTAAVSASYTFMATAGSEQDVDLYVAEEGDVPADRFDFEFSSTEQAEQAEEVTAPINSAAFRYLWVTGVNCADLCTFSISVR